MHRKTADEKTRRERFRRLKAEVDRVTLKPTRLPQDYVELTHLIEALKQLRAEIASPAEKKD